MKRNLSQGLLACLGAALIASGCAAPMGGTPNTAPAPGATAGPRATGAAFPGGAAAADNKTKNDKSTPSNPLALARLCERRRQTEEAERLYLEVIRQSPNNPVPYHRLAVLYARKGRFQESEENFQRAIALKPDDPQLLNDLGYFYHLAGRPKEAEQCLRRAVEIEPANRSYGNNLALVLGEQGRRDECLTAFRRAGSEKEARANYAFVLAQQGEYEQALDLYDRVLTDDQSSRPAADAMIELSKRIAETKSRPTSPPDEGSPAIASSQRGRNPDGPVGEVAAATPCAYTVPPTVPDPSSVPRAAPQAPRIAASKPNASALSPSPASRFAREELPASVDAARPVAAAPAHAAPVAYSTAPPAETPSPRLGLFAERMALIGIAGAIFCGIGVARRFARRPRAVAADPIRLAPVSKRGRMRRRTAVAAAPSLTVRSRRRR